MHRWMVDALGPGVVVFIGGVGLGGRRRMERQSKEEEESSFVVCRLWSVFPDFELLFSFFSMLLISFDFPLLPSVSALSSLFF